MMVNAIQELVKLKDNLILRFSIFSDVTRSFVSGTPLRLKIVNYRKIAAVFAGKPAVKRSRILSKLGRKISSEFNARLLLCPLLCFLAGW